MTEQSFPFSGDSVGDAGPYSNTLFAKVLQAILGQNLNDDAGVNYNSGDGTNLALDVKEQSPQAAGVQVKTGNAFVKGYYYENDANLNLAIDANTSGNTRIDSVILRVDFTNQTVRSVILKGTPSGSPVAPTLTQNTSFWEIRLANVTVANLFTVITDANIDVEVRNSDRPNYMPIGSVFQWAGSETSSNLLPIGWLLCDGSAISRTTYAKLFNVIGTTYGVGDGSTTFNIPDLRGRTPIGTNTANLPNGVDSSLTTRATGAEGGSETHTLVSGELASHTHVQNVVSNVSGGSTLMTAQDPDALNAAQTASNTTTAGSGSNTAHANVQPFTTLNFIVKAY